MKYLIARGGDVSSTELAYTPLSSAVKSRNKNAIKLVLDQGADVNQRYNSTAPLHYAIDNLDINIAEVPLDAGSLVASRDAKKRNTIQRLIANRDWKCKYCKMWIRDGEVGFWHISIRYSLSLRAQEPLNLVHGYSSVMDIVTRELMRLLISYSADIRSAKAQARRSEKGIERLVAKNVDRICKNKIEIGSDTSPDSRPTKIFDWGCCFVCLMMLIIWPIPIIFLEYGRLCEYLLNS
jgi:hypothetical protein